MAYVARMARIPEVVPHWYPPPNDADPAAYPLRFQWMQTLLHLMVRVGAVDARPLDAPPPDDAPASVAQFGSGAHVSPMQATIIAREMRSFMQGVPPAVFEDMRMFWDRLQGQLLAQVQARGEVAVTGFEAFPFDPAGLRNDLIHWGAFNAIAADHGGYFVE